MQLSLVVADGKHSGRSVRVKGSKFTIGRSPDCDLRANSRQISRQHCVIRVKEQSVTIRDLGSRNGTFINGEKVEAERTLADGDHLTLGRFEFDVRIVSDAAANAETTSQSVIESQAMIDTQSQAAGISGIAMSIMESLINSPADDDDDFELIGTSGKPQAFVNSKTDETTQSFTLPINQQAANESKPAESAEDADSSKGENPGEYVVSEAEKEKARKEGAIVGIAKSAQARRTTATSHEAAAEALRKLRR